MSRPPRPAGEPILTGAHWLAIAAYGALITAAVLCAFAAAHYALGLSIRQAVTVSFIALAFAQLLHTFNMRDAASPLLVNEITRNGYVWGALALCTALILLAVHLPGLLSFDDLSIDPSSRVVTVRENPVELTAKEFDMLYLLMLHPKQVFTREQLLERVWGGAQYIDPGTVTVHVRRLREKIENDPSKPVRLLTVWGVGYKFEP